MKANARYAVCPPTLAWCSTCGYAMQADPVPAGPVKRSYEIVFRCHMPTCEARGMVFPVPLTWFEGK